MVRITNCLILLGICCLFATLAWAGPVLSVPQPGYDFGTIVQGETVYHRFVFSNTGDKPLVVEKISSSCGCTAALASAKVLAPGESGEIQTSFDSARFRGEIGKTVYLYTNDPARPMVQMQIKGTVREEVTLDPQLVNFGTVAAKQTVTSRVVLVNQGPRELRLGPPETTAPELTARLSSTTVPPGGKTTLDLALTPKPGQARFSGYVLFRAAGARDHDLRVPVYADLGERAASLRSP
jgi:hypothetical protein